MDLEGLQTMRNVAHNMAWMLKCIEAGKNAGVALPATEREAKTNFINNNYCYLPYNPVEL